MVIYEDEFSDLDDEDQFGQEKFKTIGDLEICRIMFNISDGLQGSMKTVINCTYNETALFSIEHDEELNDYITYIDNFNYSYHDADNPLFNDSGEYSISSTKKHIQRHDLYREILFDIFDDIVDDKVRISGDNFLDDLSHLMRKRGADIDGLSIHSTRNSSF